MTWAKHPYGQTPWAGPVVTTSTGTPVPPPIPGATTTFRYTVNTGTAAWGVRSWGGAMPLISYPGGGVSLAPDPAAGVMRVWGWWPDARGLQIVRVAADGTRTPVRGAYPIAVAASTRRNYATNPSIEVGLNGYVPGTGTPTLTQIARADDPSGGVSALRATIASSGTDEVTVPHSLPPARATVAFDLRLSALPTGVTITLAWTNSSGSALTTSTATLTAGQYTASVAQWARQVVTLTAPNGAAVAGSLKIAAAGMPAGGQMDLDRVLAESATSDGSYGDGTSLGGVWTGTAHLSTSLLAPVQMVDDGECPLDVPVRYELFNSAPTGGRVTSPPSILESGDRVWLTHPEYPDSPVAASVVSTPRLEHVLRQALHTILDSPYPVAVSAAQRLAPGGEVQLVAPTFADRDRLLDEVFGTGMPVLLRQPGRFGRGDGEWITLGTVVEDPLDQKGWSPARVLTAPFQVVDAPADVLVAS